MSYIRAGSDKVRVHHKSENRQADRAHNTTERAGEGGQGDSMTSRGRKPLKYCLFFFFLVSCAVSREISPPYKPGVEVLVQQLTDQPYSVHILDNSRYLVRVNMHSRWIELNAQWADALMRKDPNLLRAILAHEIAHDKLGHRYALADDRHALQALELEADEEALRILHARGFSPWDYVRAMKMLKEIEDKNPSSSREQYYSSHPYAGERLEKIEAMIITLGLSPKIPNGGTEKPEWKVGYVWKYNWKGPKGSGTLTREIIREDYCAEVRSWIVKIGKNEFCYTKDLLGELAVMTDGKLITKRTPPRSFVSWPLEVGKEWRDTYLLENAQEKSSRRLVIRRVVSDIEEITIPAGKFAAFKIDSYDQSGGGGLVTEYWYSPEVKWLVKLRDTLSAGIREEELISFNVS